IDDLIFSDFSGVYKFCKNAHNHPSDAYKEDISESEPEIDDDSQLKEPELFNS
ncbi:hypothetical protein RJZ57_008396, partial [Blastomyces gilchristii]